MSLISFLFLVSVGNADEKLNIHRGWYKTPDIIICKNSKTKKPVVEKAVKFWKKHGLKVGNISYEKNDPACNDSDPFKRGYILFVGSKNLNKDLFYGTTQPWFSKKTNKMTSASVELQDEYANNSRLVTHELGHALGLLHVEDNHSIMYEWYNYRPSF